MSQAATTPAAIVPHTASVAPRTAPLAKGWPLVGLAWQMRQRPLPTMLNAFSELKSDAIFMKLGPYRATLLRNPEHLKRVFVDNAENYTKQTRGYAKARIVLGQGLVTSEGELWQRQRRIATPAFHRQRVAGFATVFTTASEQLVEKWRSNSVSDGTTIDVFGEMMRLTLRIALETLLGVRADREIDELAPAVSEGLERTNDIITNPFSLPPWVPTPKNFSLKRAISTLDRFVYGTIQRRREATAAGAEASRDLLGMLMSARDEETGQGMSDQQLRDEAVTILIAGHETTANALCWAWYLLSMNPGTRAQLDAELQAVLDGRTPNFDDLPKLRYTRAVFEEAMRLYPPAWMIGRAARNADMIGPYHIPAKTFVLVSPYVTHHHAGIWDNPEGFDPTRFLDGRSDALPKFSYLPFGGGQRFCIGATFAQVEATLILATLTQRMRLDAVPGFPVEPYAMITLRPKHGLKMGAAVEVIDERGDNSRRIKHTAKEAHFSWLWNPPAAGTP